MGTYAKIVCGDESSIIVGFDGSLSNSLQETLTPEVLDNAAAVSTSNQFTWLQGSLMSNHRSKFRCAARNTIDVYDVDSRSVYRHPCLNNPFRVDCASYNPLSNSNFSPHISAEYIRECTTKLNELPTSTSRKLPCIGVQFRRRAGRNDVCRERRIDGSISPRFQIELPWSLKEKARKPFN